MKSLEKVARALRRLPEVPSRLLRALTVGDEVTALSRRLEQMSATAQAASATAAEACDGIRAHRVELSTLSRQIDDNYNVQLPALSRRVDDAAIAGTAALEGIRAHRVELSTLSEQLSAAHLNLQAGLSMLNGRLDQASIDIQAELLRILDQVSDTRSLVQVQEDAFESLTRYRRSRAYEDVYSEEYPLVSVCVNTYNRAELLATRCLASIRAQQYPNLEIVVVGDCCTDDTEAVICGMKDPRIRFLNLPKRGSFPDQPEHGWMVAGTQAANMARSLATGSIISQLDDDDEYMPDRLLKLVRFLQETRSEVVWHPFIWESGPNEWTVNEAEQFRLNSVTTGSVVSLAWCANVEGDINAFRLSEPGDWARFRKLRYLGLRMRRHPEVLLRHYRERQNT